MDKVLEYLAKYNITPRQLITLVTCGLEHSIDDIREGEYPDLYPAGGEKLLDELNELSWRI